MTSPPVTSMGTLPESVCDLVMKGGITSGIAYPDAIKPLSTLYRFRNIGGASAGAIAAAATAAAEYGREQQYRHGRNSGSFEGLATLGGKLSEQTPGRPKQTTLQALFQPAPKARPAFDLLLALQQASNANTRPIDGSAGHNGAVTAAPRRIVRSVWRLTRLAGAVVWGLRRLYPSVLLGGATGFVLVWTVAGDITTLVATWPRVLALVVAVLVGAALGLVAGLVGRVSTLISDTLPRNLNGMCTGMPVARRRWWSERHSAAPAALTDWLHQQLQSLAGRKTDEPPLTFADLATVDLPTIDTDKGDEPGVRLQMITTDVTLARPLRLPLQDPSTKPQQGASDPLADEQDTRYFFSPTDFRRLFPASVVDHLCKSSVMVPADWAPRARGDDKNKAHHRIPDDLRTLPYDELPILVATRMSLSFPVLLSAVPLYTYRPQEQQPWVRHWLSDGGIGSNFPIHFFDSLIPRWPTLALRFVPQHNGNATDPQLTVDPDERQPEHAPRSRVRMLDPTRLSEGRRSQIHTMPGFLAAILDTMQNWSDTLQSELPGFRDRIADIELTADEGGMNLAMSKATITSVQDKGKRAGVELAEQFDWDVHRFLRYMMTMRLLDESLGADRLERAYRLGGFDEAITENIDGIVATLRDRDEESARLAAQLLAWYPAARCKWARTRTEQLLETVRGWSSDVTRKTPVDNRSRTSSPSTEPPAGAATNERENNGDAVCTFRGDPEPRPSTVLRVAPPV